MDEEEPPNLIDIINMYDEGGALDHSVSQQTSNKSVGLSRYKNESGPEKSEKYLPSSDALEQKLDGDNLVANAEANADKIEQQDDAMHDEMEEDETAYNKIQWDLLKRYEEHRNGLEDKEYCPWPWLYSFDTDFADKDYYEAKMDELLPAPGQVVSSLSINSGIYHRSKMLQPHQPSHSGQFQYS